MLHEEKAETEYVDLIQAKATDTGLHPNRIQSAKNASKAQKQAVVATIT